MFKCSELILSLPNPEKKADTAICQRAVSINKETLFSMLHLLQTNRKSEIKAFNVFYTIPVFVCPDSSVFLESSVFDAVRAATRIYTCKKRTTNILSRSHSPEFEFNLIFGRTND